MTSLALSIPHRTLIGHPIGQTGQSDSYRTSISDTTPDSHRTVIGQSPDITGHHRTVGHPGLWAPRAQIRGVFVCTLTFHELLRCEDWFTAEQVLHLFGALPRGSRLAQRERRNVQRPNQAPCPAPAAIPIDCNCVSLSWDRLARLTSHLG